MKVNFNKITTKIILLAGAVISVMLIVASTVMESIKEDYTQKINDVRLQKDHAFRTSNRSPIDNKEKFEGLFYFEPNEKYKVKAKLTLLNDTTALLINRTDGGKARYIRFANAVFTLDKKKHTLTLLKTLEKKNSTVLFLPFTDRTNGEDTYDGGRYLDIEYGNNKKTITIDFNLAYNPYCVYSYRYSCPIPPPENYLDVEIKAGEKYFQNSEE